MLVQIVNGTYGHRPRLPDGKLSDYVVPTTRFDPPIEVADEEAERLVKLGIAEYVHADAADVATVLPEAEDPAVNTTEEETAQNGSEGQENENGDDLTDDEDITVFTTDMKVNELRAAMQERGLNIHVGMTKREMVEALNGSSDAPVLEAEGVIDE